MVPNRKILDEALLHIGEAPKDTANIEYLCNRPGFGERNFSTKLKASASQGVENCRWTQYPWMKLEDGSPDPRIQVCIIPRRVLDLVWQEGGDDIHPGDTFAADFETSEDNMPVGTLLKSGDVVLRVSDVWNNACTKWKARYGVDALEWVRDHPKLRLRGLLCEIVEDGELINGAQITVISRPSAE